MDTNNLNHFKHKLIKQKQEVQALLKEMKENDVIGTNADMENELSNYDNHPADAAGNLYDKERGLALKEHEMSLIKKIDEALIDVEKGTYGKCKRCGKDILIERLEFIPYAQYCTKCQEKINNMMSNGSLERPIEESVLTNPFGYGYNDFKDKVEFDAEDSYQSVERFNRLRNISEYYNYDDEDLYVEPIERISNEQYKNQLPD